MSEHGDFGTYLKDVRGPPRSRSIQFRNDTAEQAINRDIGSISSRQSGLPYHRHTSQWTTHGRTLIVHRSLSMRQ